MHNAMRETLENAEANAIENPAHPNPWLKAKHFHRSKVNDSFYRAKTKCGTWFRRLTKTKKSRRKEAKKRLVETNMVIRKRSGTGKDPESKKNENSLRKKK